MKTDIQSQMNAEKPDDVLENMERKSVVRIHVAEKPTTGSKWADKQVNDAVDAALLRLLPMIRDTIRAEIKEVLQIEEIE